MKNKKNTDQNKRQPRIVRWMEAMDLGNNVTHEHINKHLPYVLLVFVLALVYVANAFYAERTVREVNTISRSLNEKRWYYMTNKFDLEKQSVQSKLGNSVASHGLKELTAPPVKIDVAKSK